MNYKHLIGNVCVMFSLLYVHTPLQTEHEQTKAKKKIIIFSCSAGKAHERTAQTLVELLENNYTVEVVDIFTEVLRSLDPFQTISGSLLSKPFSAQDVYNVLLQKRMLFIANRLLVTGNRFMAKSKKIEKLVGAYVKDKKPDLVISVIPVVNHGILRACRASSIPFIVTTLDLNPRYWANGLTKADCSYQKFIYTLPFNDARLHRKNADYNLTPANMVVSGYPVHPQFYETYNTIELKKKYNIPSDKPVIMLMMGGVGSSAILEYARRILHLNIPLHLLICLGTSDHLIPKINVIKKNPCTSYSIFTFTPHIAPLMAMSELLITKGGANSVAEALHMNVPMLIDKTNVFFLEKENIRFVTSNAFGETINSFDAIRPLLLKYLKDTILLQSLKTNIKAYKKEHFNVFTLPLIEKMINEPREA